MIKTVISIMKEKNDKSIVPRTKGDLISTEETEKPCMNYCYLLLSLIKYYNPLNSEITAEVAI